MKKILLATLVIFITLGGLVYWQYKPFLEQQVENAMLAKGLKNVSVTLSRAGIGGAVFKEIRFGDENPIILENVTLYYTLSDLRAGRLDEILLQKLAIVAVQQEAGWTVFGLEGLKTTEPDPDYNPLSVIPVTQAELNAIPFRRIAIKESALELRSAFGTMQIPVELEWQKSKPAQLTYQGDEIKLIMEAIELNFPSPQLQATLSEGQWEGTWQSRAHSNNTLLTAFGLNGAVQASQSQIALNGTFKSDDEAYQGDFTFEYAPANAASMIFKSDMNVNLAREEGNLALPLHVEWSLQDRLSVEGKGGSAQFQSGNNAINAENITLNLRQNEDQSFAGAGNIGTIKITAPLPVPPLKADTKFTYKQSKLDMSGQLFSADKSWLVNYMVSMGNEKASADGIRIKNAKMPWNNGRISAENIWYPFAANKPVPIRIQIDRVDLAALMGSMTAERLQAQGAVSGYVDVEITSSGDFTIKDAQLAADGPGTITMPPEMIPADNEQVNLVKDIMEDLHFKVLNMNMDSDGNGNDIIKLTVEGNNPKVYGGHPVKLNINLTGNLIDFAEQNIMLLTRPDQFLKGKSNDNQDE